jgi:DNA repair protein RadC
VAAARFDRPRERLRREGAQALSTSDLLALVLGTGSARAPAAATAAALLERFGTLEALDRAGEAELAALPGLGPAKVAALRAAFEIGSRLVRGPLRIGERLSSPEQVYEHFGVRLRRCRQERFLTLLVDTRHRLVAEVEVSRGSLNQSLVHPREVLSAAVRESAAAVLALHNHPSGDPLPSREDHEVTRRLAEAGEILGIRLLDHVVVGGDGFVSFAREGWLASQGGWQGRR